MTYPKSWASALSDEISKPYFLDLLKFISSERTKGVVYPPKGLVFNAFKATPLKSVRAVILGQDPYHNPKEAHGLSFSVPKGIRIPPSLRNIHKELNSDLGFNPPKHGNLMSWAENGVLLLNSVMTVRAHCPGSHKDKGWELFTDAVIRILGSLQRPVAFVLWGNYARGKRHLVESRHMVLEAAHPSPMSCYRGFFGSRPFSSVNDFLASKGLQPVNWELQ